MRFPLPPAARPPPSRGARRGAPGRPGAGGRRSPSQQQQAIGEIVRDYLLKNPEVLQEVMAELEKRQAETQRVAQASALKENRQTLLNAPHSHRRRQPARRRHAGRVLRLQLRLLQARARGRPQRSSSPIRSCASC